MEKIRNYLKKMQGTTKSPPGVSLSEVFWSWTGAFLGIGAVAWIHYNLLNDGDVLMIIGSFGASAVLLYGAVKSPLAQPRNLLGGHVISALIGVTAQKLLQDQMWFASALAVATSIAVMHATRTLHPPGGATALIAVTGSEKIHDLGYWYTIVPVGVGATIMLAVALLVNNIPGKRKYPEFWL
jgi:CBS-domain-containing membrane protein